MLEVTNREAKRIIMGRSVTYRPTMLGEEWDTFAEVMDLEQEHDYDTYFFDYAKNTLTIKHQEEGNFGMGQLTYKFALRNGTFDEFNKPGKALKPSHFKVIEGNTAGEDTELDLTLLNIACWFFNTSPAPKFQ